LRFKGVIHFPILKQVAFVDDKNERDFTRFFAGTLLKFAGFFERGPSRAVGHQQVTRCTAQIAPTHFLVVVFAINVPKNQGNLAAVNLDIFLFDFHAHGGLVDIRVDAFDKAPDKTGLANGEGTEHADFLLEHSR